MDNLTVSASVLDLGFVKWSKGATKIASANPEAINIAGDNYLTGIDPNNIDGSVIAVQSNINRLQNDANGYMDRVMVVMYSTMKCCNFRQRTYINHASLVWHLQLW